MDTATMMEVTGTLTREDIKNMKEDMDIMVMKVREHP